MEKLLALWKHRYRKSWYLIQSYAYFLLKFSYLRLRSLITRKPTIAIVLAEQFGDIVACEPVGRKVRAMHPDAYLIWIVRKPFRELLEFNPNLNSIWNETHILETILLLDNQAFDKVYNLHFTHRQCPYTFCKLVNSRSDELGINVHTYYFHGCILEVFAEIAGLPRLNETPQLYIPHSTVQKIAGLNLPKKFIVIHCQSNQLSRNWRTQHWNTLVQRLFVEFDYSIVEIGLASDLDIVDERYLNLCGTLTLLDTAEVIKRANYFIGIDSGPAHFANAMGVFGFLLIGKLADFTTHIPYSGNYGNGQNALIIRKKDGPSADIALDDVWRAISKKLTESQQ